MPQIKPTAAQMDRAFELYYNRLFRFFVPYLWINRIPPIIETLPEFPAKHAAVVVVLNACVETALMGLRDLDDFFRPNRRNDKPNSIRASDFGFRAPNRVLSFSERASINTHAAHLSYAPVLAK